MERQLYILTMTDSNAMTRILEDLAAGRIDTAEAGRRLDALSSATPGGPASTLDQPVDAPATPAGETPSGEALSGEALSGEAPSGEGLAGEAAGDGATPAPDQPGEMPAPDAWAATTDRPQRPSQTRERLRPTRRPAPTGGVEKLSVRAVGRRVRIIAEPSVSTVSADGPHMLRRNGAVLEVSSDGELGASIDGFQLLRATRSLDDFRSLGLGKELLLRVNPDLLVDVEVTAGSLTTDGVSRLGSVRVTAGGARLLGVEQIGDALVQAGQATVNGLFREGRSRIRVESGSLTLQVVEGSDLTVTTDAQLGRVSWGGEHAGFTGNEVVIGRGTARLDLEVVMGHASVRSGFPASAGAA